MVNTAGLGGQSVTATVEIGGLDPSCTRTSSVTTSITARPKAARLDEYVSLSLNTEKTRLRQYAQQLKNAPTSHGYIVVYAGRIGRSAGALKHAHWIEQYLVDVLKVEATRLVVLNGPIRQQRTIQLWIVPEGATPPEVEGAQ